MPVRLNLDQGNTVEREVVASFGSFFVTIRQPSSFERMTLRHHWLSKQFDELHQLRHSLVTGWRGVQDADGNELPYNRRNHELILRVQPIQDAINLAVSKYIEESDCILDDDKKKVSEQPPGSTPATAQASQ